VRAKTSGLLQDSVAIGRGGSRAFVEARQVAVGVIVARDLLVDSMRRLVGSPSSTRRLGSRTSTENHD